MFIKFEELKWKNFISYGNQDETLSFNSGLNLIVGNNGHGKSVILDALSFALFGLPYRKITLQELVNRKNKSKLSTELTFSIKEDKYCITRTMQPNSIKIEKNGSEVDLLSSKRLTQEEINKIIGIDHNIFRQIISLAINYNKPFLSLSSAEKRDIIETIFNIKILADMLKNVKKYSGGARSVLEIKEKSIQILETNIRNNKNHIEELKKTISNFDKNKEDDLKALDAKVERWQTECKKIEDNISTILANKIQICSLSATKIETLEKENADIVKNVGIEKFKISNYKKDIQILLTNSICPVCNTDITPAHKESELKRLNELVEESLVKSGEYLIRTSFLNVKISEAKSLREQERKFDSDIDKLKHTLSSLEKQIKDVAIDKRKVMEREINFNIDKTIEVFEKQKEDYRTTYKEYKECLTNINNYNIVSEILSDTGIKSYFFRKYIPILNAKINEYLNLFEITVKMEFDENMNEKIITMDSRGESVNYFSFSEGEKKRIDMSILLSFIALTKLISNWNCNLILMDEILDSSIDSQGMDNLIQSINNMKHDKELCVYIMSHRSSLCESNYFDDILEAKKISDFSKLIKIK